MELDMTLGGIASLCGVLLFLATATVSLRFVARYKQNASFQLDDGIVAGAWICFVGLNALVFYGISQRFIGYDQPKDTEILNAQHPTLERVFLSLDGLCIMALGLGKLGALFFYRRIFCIKGLCDTFSVVSAAYIVTVAIWTVVFFVMTWNLCGHHSINWDVQVGHSAFCKLDYPYFKGSTISDFILEVFILSLPIPKIWSLNLVTSRKIAVTGVFLLALVGLAASIARMIITLNNVHHGVHVVVNGKIVNKSRDVYRTETQLAYCIILEAGCTIIAVNMPSLWYYMSGISPESIVRSVRSLVSLGSGHSSQQNSSKHMDNPACTRRSFDTSFSTSMKPGSASAVESFPMNKLGNKLGQDGVEEVPFDRGFRPIADEV